MTQNRVHQRVRLFSVLGLSGSARAARQWRNSRVRGSARSMSFCISHRRPRTGSRVKPSKTAIMAAGTARAGKLWVRFAKMSGMGHLFSWSVGVARVLRHPDEDKLTNGCVQNAAISVLICEMHAQSIAICKEYPNPEVDMQALRQCTPARQLRFASGKNHCC